MRSATTTASPNIITMASALAGAPVRGAASPSRVVMKPSRPSANRIRDAPAAHPSPLAKALMVAPKLIASSMPLPAYVFERSPRGAPELENAFTPAASIPNPSDWASITIV